jgi:flagellar motor switch protein FliN/FliY
MSHEPELPTFERPAATVEQALAGAGADLGRLSDVPVELAVEIGRTHMTVGATLELRPGSVVVLDRMAGEPVDLLVNGTPIARGEVVVIDEEFALRITDVLGERAVLEPAISGAPAADALKPAEGAPITGEPATS